ncbi:PLDc N-terminal domain-containing protein [uncultured Pseudokineococcus sp.]|uniref:PLDc N-terminal domain-containing protein n=1 Tax=uncultured Pseudokineococcus sp. TaxID=1642928 RepID=UPI00260D8C51|nr:PLDc N-terminal domain-containing protein [uncultured Pseudokineococcus sp.]
MLAELFSLPAQVAAVVLAVDLVIRVLALLTVPRGRLPTAGLAWLMTIFFLPVVGGLVYLVIGRAQLPQERKEHQARASERFARRAKELDDLVVHDPYPRWLGGLTRLMGTLGASPLLRGGAGRRRPRHRGPGARPGRGSRRGARDRPRRLLHAGPRRHDLPRL